MDTLVVIEKMVLGNIIGQMEILIEVNFVKIWEKDKDKWFGTMGVLTMVNGKEVYLMEKLGIFKVKGEKPRAGFF